MKKLYIFSALIILVNVKLQAQVQVNMTDENANPDYVEGHIPFLSLDFAHSNSTFFAEVGGRLKIKRFYADVNYHISYVNGLDDTYFSNPTVTANSIYNYKASQDVRALVGYMVFQKEVSTTVTFRLKSQGQTTYVTKVPSKKTFYLMADLGFRKGFTWVYCGGKQLQLDPVSVPEGFTAPLPEAVRTMMDYSMLQVGISTGSMGFYKASISGYGERTAKQSVRYYADMLILLGSKIDDVYQENSMIGPTQDISLYTHYGLNNSARSKVGFCIGASLDNIRHFGIQESAEAAYIPGIKGNFMSNFCFTIKSSFSLAKILN